MTENTPLKYTPLHDLHREQNAKLVPFAGYEMPVQYPSGIIKEHKHTRASAGLFDVSHMGQISIKGARAAIALESLMPMDIVGLKPGKQRYGLLTNELGGVIDDLMITRRQDDFLLVVNAACKDNDLAHLQSSMGDEVEITPLETQALLALQGPKAAEVLNAINPDTSDLPFMSGDGFLLDGIQCFISRSGYCGEDGFEISLPAEHADAISRELLANENVALIGLGARDSLRLEAGLCLYGHELSETISPVEADLAWAIQKSRRAGGERAGGFPGDAKILEQLTNGTPQRRTGIRPLSKAPVREGAELFIGEQRVGIVTSGGFGPSVDGPVAMAMVDVSHTSPGCRLNAQVRNREIPVEVCKLPFVKHNYARLKP